MKTNLRNNDILVKNNILIIYIDYEKLV